MKKMYIISDGDGGLIISVWNGEKPFEVCDRIERLGITVDMCKRYGHISSIIASNVMEEHVARVIMEFNSDYKIVVDGQPV